MKDNEVAFKSFYTHSSPILTLYKNDFQVQVTIKRLMKNLNISDVRMQC